jgi:osmoprotectant transport system permease protein
MTMPALLATAGLGTETLHSFTFMGNNLSHLLHDTLGTLELCAAALGVALVITLPGAVWLGHLHRGSSAAIRTANLGRSLPELALIAIFLALFGIGFINVMLALVIVGIPPILANAYTAVDGVDPDVVDAARGMGMTGLQVLLKAEIPLALPLMFAGIRTSVLFIVGASPLAAVAGGGGLGEIIVNQASYGFSGVLAASIWVAALALIIQALFAYLMSVLTPTGLKVGANAGATRGIDTGVADAERVTGLEAGVV